MAVHYEVRDGIVEAVIDAPPLNILTRSLMRELREALERAIDEPDLRVLLLRAEGKHFSAGASVEEHLPGQVDEMIPEFMETVRTIEAFPLPVVVAVHGRCLGGALEVALAGDLIVAGERALLGVPEIALGVFPPAACVQLPRLAGARVAAEMIFSGNPITAHAALERGLLNRVVPDDRVTEQARELAASVARHSGAALRSAKSALRAGVSHAAQDAEVVRIYLEELMCTADAEEGLRSFVEKRQPQWSHS